MIDHRLVFKVSRGMTLDTQVMAWSAVPVGVAAGGGVSGESLAELFAEVEAIKHFCLDLPVDTPVTVDFVYDVPGVSEEELAAYHRLQENVATRLQRAGLSDEDRAALLNVRSTGFAA
jgi:hypothetical protein